MPPRVRAVQEPRVTGRAGTVIRAASDARGMAVEPRGTEGRTKPAPPTSVVLADARLTVRAPLPRVFDALVNPERLGLWWARDLAIEAELGGRYEGTLPEGRVEGTITAIDGPGRLSYTWPIAREGGSVETSVVYQLAPKGSESFVHLIHRSPRPVAGDWDALWLRLLGSLKTLLEAGAPDPA